MMGVSLCCFSGVKIGVQFYPMDVEQYISHRSFRFLKPSTPLPAAFTTLLYRHPRIASRLECTNTANVRDASLREALSTIAKHRLSTLRIGILLQRFVEQMPEGTCYLNIGVWYGYSFFAGMHNNPDKRCIGVDNFCLSDTVKQGFYETFSTLESPIHTFVEADFCNYLTTMHTEPIGVYFFDGPHDYQSQYDALTMAEPFFAPGCIILVDDTNWQEPREATEQFLRERDGAYELLADVRTACDRHPTFWNGLMILRKNSV